MAKKVFLILSIILILVLIISAFFYFALSKPNYEKPKIDIDIQQISSETEFVLEPNHISYILAELGFYQLHNPPLSAETPKINLKVNDDFYSSEIKQGNIYTKQEASDSPDLIIYTSSQEILSAITSENIKDYLKTSISSGKTELELKASYPELFSKGYLSLYEELTGESLSGSTIKIFTQG